MEKRTALTARFVNVWQRFDIDDERLRDFGNALISAYAGAERHYHSGVHLEDVLSQIDFAKTALEKTGEVEHLDATTKQRLFDTIELALWYHDVIYDATKKDNEAQSRDLFLAHAKAVGLDENVQRVVARLIDITAHHKDAKTLDEKILTDCDLAILGADPVTFKKYDDNIRKEYAHVPAPLYAAGRKKVLEGFLNQPEIFKTKAFRQQFEDAAKRNLSGAIAEPGVFRKFINKLNPF